MRRGYKAKTSDVESADGGGVETGDSAADMVPLSSDASADPDPSPPATLQPPNAELAGYAAVFFLAMIVHEVALEAASTAFSHVDALTSAVTLFQFGFCFLLPVLVSGPGAVLETFPRKASDAVPYVKLSVVVFGATALATKSLNYVSYPTKVVFKSAKLIPTMVVARIVNPGSSKYGGLDYISAGLLCAGAAGYSFGSGPAGGGGGGGNTSAPGIALLTASVICDALVPNLQQKLMAPPMPQSPVSVSTGGGKEANSSGLSAAALMVNVNAVGFAGLLLYMVLSGSLVMSMQAALAGPALLLYLTLVGLGLSTAVLAYTRLIQGAGSVAAVAVATLRKVATVVLSYVIFPKALLRIHVISGLLVLGGVLLNTYSRQRQSAPRR
eukprot:CAMPEP_0183316028 /NCGR_PEP_ID=MMETSP0160_2-20130417/53622_1 /TAXON_ID=2839 ORGANISM="Odontella Sinensis, Strain Grunow 1884" /NCGR_SAMPLE_ID=MMETSP0160_2 /ASSEMBLY_ACC=CAM_ASM_000250 /LENGTH=383 /DNA_ID=CAMNT_0025481723 /DNA_START=29 /DNA_END=1180 /DNA_ORIENTATION=+